MRLHTSYEVTGVSHVIEIKVILDLLADEHEVMLEDDIEV